MNVITMETPERIEYPGSTTRVYIELADKKNS